MLKYLVFLLLYSSIAGAVDLPECNDKLLQEKVKAEIQEIYSNTNVLSPKKMRAAKLLSEYGTDFKEIDIKKFEYKEEYNIADIMMNLKMNEKVVEKDMRLCINTYKNPKYMYLLMHKKNDEIVVDIVNISTQNNFTQKTAIKY